MPTTLPFAVAAVVFAVFCRSFAADSGETPPRYYFADPVEDAPIVRTIAFPKNEEISFGIVPGPPWENRILEIYNQDWIGFRVRFDNAKGEIVFNYAEREDGAPGFFLPSGAKTEVNISGMSVKAVGDINYRTPLRGDGSGPLHFFGPFANVASSPPTPVRIYLLPEAANGLMATSVKMESGGWVTSMLLMPFERRGENQVPAGFDFSHDPAKAISLPEDGQGEFKRPHFSEAELRSSMLGRRQRMGPPRPIKRDPAKARSPITITLDPGLVLPSPGTFFEISNLDFIPYLLDVDPEAKVVNFVQDFDRPQGREIILAPGAVVSIPSPYISWTLRGNSGNSATVPVTVHPIAAVNIVPDYADGLFGMKVQVGDESLDDATVLFTRRARTAEGWPPGLNPDDYVKPDSE